MIGTAVLQKNIHVIFVASKARRTHVFGVESPRAAEVRARGLACSKTTTRSHVQLLGPLPDCQLFSFAAPTAAPKVHLAQGIALTAGGDDAEGAVLGRQKKLQWIQQSAVSCTTVCATSALVAPHTGR